MPQALRMLMKMHFRGKFRRMLSGVRTPRGAVFLLLGIVVLCLWLGPSIFLAIKTPRADPQRILTVAPFSILGFCIGNLFASIGETAVAFTAAEVDFLFPGPFTRRQLLTYKIGKTALGTIFTAIVFTFILLKYCSWWLACIVGIWLTVQFMQLFAMTVMMIGQTLGERLYSAARRGAVILVLAVVAIAVLPRLAVAMREGPVELMRQVHATLAGKILLAPFDVFARTLIASTAQSLAIWGTTALAIDLLLFATVIGLDSNYLETAATVSQRRYERQQRFRRTGGVMAMGSSGGTKLRVPSLPFLAGVGPIAWRQLTTAIRSSRGLLLLIGIIVFSAGAMIWENRGEVASSLGPFVGLIVWVNVVVVSMLKFDFRDELDRLDFLRSLPISPLAVAAGELVAPVLVLTAVQALLLIAVATSIRGAAIIVVPAAAFAVPFNVLLVAIENLLFLMFPLRAAGLIAGDMQLFGRQMVVFLCKFILLVVAATVASVFGTIGYILGGKSWPVFGVFAWVALCAVTLGILPLLSHAYSRFDPSIDTPP
ncbi:MAG: putative ABC exporter domain-containing protein [Planctomycetota bacterium]|nr:putative ABC exporter domain-containing protein [Planctomycetota bacterium]